MRGSLGRCPGSKSLRLVHEVNGGDEITGGEGKKARRQRNGSEEREGRTWLLGGVWRRPLLKLW